MLFEASAFFAPVVSFFDAVFDAFFAPDFFFELDFFAVESGFCEFAAADVSLCTVFVAAGFFVFACWLACGAWAPAVAAAMNAIASTFVMSFMEGPRMGIR